MANAPDTIKKVAVYADNAFSVPVGQTTGVLYGYLGTPFEDTVIATWKAKGINLAYLSNSNVCNGYTATTYGATWIPKIKVFVAKCKAQGIDIGMVIGITSTGPANRIKNYNASAAANEKILFALEEEEYWNGTMTFAAFKALCQATYNILNPVGVSCDVYIVEKLAGELVQLIPMIDIYWLTTYTNNGTIGGGDWNKPRYDKLRPWIQSLAATLPGTPIKAGALVSAEDVNRNAGGVATITFNSLGFWFEGRRLVSNSQVTAGTGFTNPQPIVTSPKTLYQCADQFTHNGVIGLPPIDFNSESNTIKDYIDWQGIQVYAWRFLGALNIPDVFPNEVWAIGDGAVGTTAAANIPAAKAVAANVPYSAARFLYLGDVYNTGSVAEYTSAAGAYDKIYGSQSGHNLSILTSAIPGNHEWGNRVIGYDPYWNGAMAGSNGVLSPWDGDRTQTNPRYYSFFVGTWKFICINSMEDGFSSGGVSSGSTMHTWLVNELSDPGVKKIVICHHPRWSDSVSHGDNTGMQPLWAAMQGHALLLITGHDHNYQRHEMRNTAGAVVTGGGVYQYVIGAGGQDQYAFLGSYTDINGDDPVAGRSQQFGALRIRLSDDRVDTCYILQNGTAIDCFTALVESNVAPVVNAGGDQSITLPATASLSGSYTDDGFPDPPAAVNTIWTKISGPGTVTFGNALLLSTTASFSSAGTYVLRLTANDSQLQGFDEMTVTVSAVTPTKLITLKSSNPNSGVTITPSVNDLNSLGAGSTTFTRLYNTATSVDFTAPGTASGNIFQKWLKDGVDYSFLNTITETGALAHEYTAVYVSPPSTSTVYWVDLTANQPDTPYAVDIADINGDPTGLSGNIIDNLFYHAGDVATFTYQDPHPITGQTLIGISVSRNGIGIGTFAGTSYAVTFDGNYHLRAKYDEDTPAPLDYFSASVYSGPVVCNGGQYTVFAQVQSPGTFVYSWSTGATTSSLALYAGTYTLAITCTGGAVYANMSMFFSNIIVSTPDPITGTATIIDPLCFGANGSVSINSVGGTGVHTYLWSSGETTQSISQPAGSYTVGVTDENGCTATLGPFVVTDPTPISIDSAVVVDVTCGGGSNGSIDISVSGGSTPYVISWIASNGIIVPPILNPTNLPVGVYDVTITDAGGCTSDTETYTIGGPTILTGSVSTVDSSCNPRIENGEATITAGGGTSPYEYNFGSGFSSSDTETGLAPGSYLATIRDSNGCTLVVNYTIVASPPLEAVIAEADIVNVSCNGAADGEVTVTIVTGASAFITYSLDGGTAQSSPSFTGLDAGPHSILVDNAIGCQVTVDFDITEPSQILLRGNAFNTSAPGASDGSIQIIVSGGSYPIDISWSNGRTDVVLAAGTVLTETGLIAGSYDIEATDVNGCQTTITRVVNDPSPEDPTGDPGTDPETLPNITYRLKKAACCLGDKIYDIFNKLSKGHTDIECEAIQAMTLSSIIKSMRYWYPLDVDVSYGKKAYFAFTADTVPIDTNSWWDVLSIHFQALGLPMVDFDGDGGFDRTTNLDNLTIALQAAGYDAEFDSISDIVWVYAPANCAFNGHPASLNMTSSLPGRPHGIVKILTKNGFMGAQDPCNSSDILISNCLNETDINNMIQQINYLCDDCLCCNDNETTDI